MATTPNYAWTTPDDTNLVKNGAADIRTLANAIDSTVKSNADATIPKSIIDAAGDLIVGSAADTVTKLSAGTNGQVLSIVANAPTWTDPAGGTPISVTEFTAGGTYSVPSNAKWLYVTAIGGGAGGAHSGGSTQPGLGGVSGYIVQRWVSVTGGASLTVTIGAGGSAGDPSGAGGNTSLGTILTAQGGTGSDTVRFGRGSNRPLAPSYQGTSNISGGHGGPGLSGNTSTNTTATDGAGSQGGRGGGGYGAGGGGGWNSGNGGAGASGYMLIVAY